MEPYIPVITKNRVVKIYLQDIVYIMKKQRKIVIECNVCDTPFFRLYGWQFFQSLFNIGEYSSPLMAFSACYINRRLSAY